jgi:hypothetical protein
MSEIAIYRKLILAHRTLRRRQIGWVPLQSDSQEALTARVTPAFSRLLKCPRDEEEADTRAGIALFPSYCIFLQYALTANHFSLHLSRMAVSAFTSRAYVGCSMLCPGLGIKGSPRLRRWLIINGRIDGSN